MAVAVRAASPFPGNGAVLFHDDQRLGADSAPRINLNFLFEIFHNNVV